MPNIHPLIHICVVGRCVSNAIAETCHLTGCESGSAQLSRGVDGLCPAVIIKPVCRDIILRGRTITDCEGFCCNNAEKHQEQKQNGGFLHVFFSIFYGYINTLYARFINLTNPA